MKKIIKIVGLFLLSVIVILSIAFMVINSKYSSELPTGKTGEEAELLTQNILKALNYKAYKETDVLSWKFRNNTYVWDKNKNEVLISWDKNTVLLNTKDKIESIVKTPENISFEEKIELIEAAEKSFNNDSFWLIAPYKILDDGVVRTYIPATDTENASLLITYSSGGTTPGDSYQWFVNDEFIPTKFKMWVNIIPIDGLTATWSNWETTTTGAVIASKRMIIDKMEIPLSEIKSYNNN